MKDLSLWGAAGGRRIFSCSGYHFMRKSLISWAISSARETISGCEPVSLTPFIKAACLFLFFGELPLLDDSVCKTFRQDISVKTICHNFMEKVRHF